MSKSTAVARYQGQAAVADAQVGQELARLEAQANIIARTPGLKKGIKVDGDAEATRANVMAICLSSLSYGIQPNLTNINQWDVIEGQAVPSTQLMQGMVTALTGHRLSVTGDDESATAVLQRNDTGERHEETYTVEMARRSGALDVAVEQWEKAQGSGKFYLNERVVLGYDLAEVQAPGAPRPEWAQHGPNSRLKYNPAWHLYRSDMLKRRAVRRAIRFGAPEIAAGVVAPRQLPEPEWSTAPTIRPTWDIDSDEVEDSVALNESPATTSERPVAEAEVTDDARDDLRNAIAVLSEEARRRLGEVWKAAGLPPIDSAEFGHADHVQALMLIVETMVEDRAQGHPDDAGDLGRPYDDED